MIYPCVTAIYDLFKPLINWFPWQIATSVMAYWHVPRIRAIIGCDAYARYVTVLPDV
jgi:hypothetical protein